MSFKKRIKPFVPPILWSALSSAAKQTPKAPNSRQLLETVTHEDFTVRFRQTTHPQGTFFVPEYAAHRQAAVEILSGRLYEPKTHDLVSKVLAHRPGCMVHAGTFFGDMLPTFSRACSETLYAFEPVLENYVLAKLCIESNALSNVMLFNAGLGEAPSVARINTGTDGGTHRGGGSKISEHGQLTGLMAIDNLDPPNLSIIQLDVEGHELLALQGATRSIERHAPIIMVEDNNRACEPFLTSMGYSLIFEVPGLFIWSQAKDADFLRHLENAEA